MTPPLSPPLDAESASAFHEGPEGKVLPFRSADEQRQERAQLIGQAARMLGLNEAHLRYWIEGKDRKPPPKDQGAEEKLVGSVLLWGNKALVRVKDLVEPEELTHPAYKVIWEAALDLDRAGHGIDTITVAQQLKANDTFSKLQAYRGEADLEYLAGRAPGTIENIEHYPRLIREKALQRGVLELAQELQSRAQGEPDLEKLTESLRDKVTEIQGRLPRKKVPLFDPQAWLQKALVAMAEPIPPKLSFGLTALDEATEGGFPAGSVGALAAPPKHLKTGLLVSLILRWARNGQKIVVVTGENTVQEWLARLSAHEQFGKVKTSHSAIKHRPDLAKDNLAFIEWLAGKVEIISLPDEERKAHGGLRWRDVIPLLDALPEPPFVVVDYLEEMADRTGGAETEQAANKGVIRLLRGYAARRRTRVLVVSSVGRGHYSGAESVFQNPNARPEDFMPVAKHSGCIDYAAGFLLALQYSDGEKITDPETGHDGVPMRLHLAFAREGTGPVTVPVLSFGAYCRFMEDPRGEEALSPTGENNLPGLKGKILRELQKEDNKGGQIAPMIARLVVSRPGPVKEALREMVKDHQLVGWIGERGAIYYRHPRFGPAPSQGQLFGTGNKPEGEPN